MSIDVGTVTFTLLLRSPWGSEIDLGALAVDQSEPNARIKMALAAGLNQIAGELTRNAWDGPVCPTPWLDNVELTEFTDTVPRQRSFTALTGRCGAMPARAFRGRYPEGCLAVEGHTGSHFLDPVLARRAERRAATLA